MLNENLIKGQIIELKVQIELLRYGFDVSVPNYNSSKYDLIADTGDELLRIQVKKSISNSQSSFTFSCTTQNVKSSFGAKHKYTNSEIDYFATVWNDKVYLIPVDETSTQKTIQFNDETYLANNILSAYNRLSDEELYNSTHKNKFYCIDCGCEIGPEAKRCVSCNNKLQRVIERPDRETLKNLIRTTPFTEIGKQYKVTDNTIRKWCDSYKLPRKTGDIKKISEEEWKEV
jgi:hypothetical protein